jgi:hypothetical protein
MIAPARRRYWIWVLVVLFVLPVVGIVVLIVFNLSQQLRPEELSAARKLWDQKKPADYDLLYTVRRADDPNPITYEVHVRKGRVESALMNKKIKLGDDTFRHADDMTALLNHIESFLRQDTKDKRKVFVIATFDEEDGHLLKYVRRVAGTRERVEIEVQQFRRLDRAESP